MTGLYSMLLEIAKILLACIGIVVEVFVCIILAIVAVVGVISIIQAVCGKENKK